MELAQDCLMLGFGISDVELTARELLVQKTLKRLTTMPPSKNVSFLLSGQRMLSDVNLVCL